MKEYQTIMSIVCGNRISSFSWLTFHLQTSILAKLWPLSWEQNLQNGAVIRKWNNTKTWNDGRWLWFRIGDGDTKVSMSCRKTIFTKYLLWINWIEIMQVFFHLNLILPTEIIVKYHSYTFTCVCYFCFTFFKQLQIEHSVNHFDILTTNSGSV